MCRAKRPSIPVILLTIAAITLPPFIAAPHGEDQRPASSGGMNASIEVHGHWTIELRNEDGRVAAKHVFENALIPDGARWLSEVLAGVRPNFGHWEVWLNGGVSCAVNLNPLLGCRLVQIDPQEYPRLTVEIPVTGPNAGHVVLHGNATALANAQISTVATILRSSPDWAGFSLRHLTAPISVAEGQVITVTVVFTFS